MRHCLFAFAALIAFALTAEPASARLFEPQPNWWSSGETCVASRPPPGRRSRATPARSCARGDALRAEIAAPVSAKAKPAPAMI